LIPHIIINNPNDKNEALLLDVLMKTSENEPVSSGIQQRQSLPGMGNGQE